MRFRNPLIVSLTAASALIFMPHAAFASGTVTYTLSADKHQVNLGEPFTLTIGMQTSNGAVVGNSVVSQIIDTTKKYAEFKSIDTVGSGFDSIIRRGLLAPNYQYQYASNGCITAEQTSTSGITSSAAVARITLVAHTAGYYPFGFLTNGQCSLSATSPSGEPLSINNNAGDTVLVIDPLATPTPTPATPKPQYSPAMTAAQLLAEASAGPATPQSAAKSGVTPSASAAPTAHNAKPTSAPAPKKALAAIQNVSSRTAVLASKAANSKPALITVGGVLVAILAALIGRRILLLRKSK